MRDIRDDLKQRVQLLRLERDQMQAALKAKLAELDAYEAQLSGLLALEEKRVQATASNGPPMPLLDNPPPEPNWSSTWVTTLGAGASTATAAPEDETEDATDDEFEAEILKIIADGQPWAHAAIKHSMEKSGWVLEKGSLGRALQGQLLSLKQRGAVEYLQNSTWRKLQNAAATKKTAA
jgi:hypothetical protein